MLTPLISATSDALATGRDHSLEAALRALCHDHLLLLDHRGFIRAASRPAAEWLGAHPDDLLGQSLSSLLGRDSLDAEWAKQLLERVRTRGEAQADVWLRKRTGASAWTQIRLEADLELNEPDIALLLVPHQQIPAELERLRTLLRHTPAGLWMTNAAGHLLEISPAFSRLSAGAAPGDHWPAHLRHVHPDYWPAAREARHQAIAQHRGYRVEYLDPHERRLIESAEPRLDSQGAFLGLAGTLAESPELASASADTSFQYVGRLSHEVREQANRILRSLDLAADGNPSLAALQADNIEASARVLLRQVDNVAALSRQPQARDNIVFEPQALLRGVLDEAASLAPQPGGVIQTEVEGQLPPRLLGDATKLRRLLRLMLEHAVLAAPSGPVSFHLTTRELPEGAWEFAMEARFAGPAIDSGLEEWLASEDENPTAFGDLGIRLRLARQAAMGLGGALAAIESGRIAARVPLQHAPEEAPGASLVPFTQIDLGGRRALIVALDPLRGILAKRLQDAGLSFTSFDSALEARRWLDQTEHPPELVLIQFSQPGLDGCELARWIRQIRPRLPMITVSMQGEPGQGKAAREAGFQGYLTPPLAQTLVADAMRLVLAWGVRANAPLVTRFRVEEEHNALAGRL